MLTLIARWLEPAWISLRNLAVQYDWALRAAGYPLLYAGWILIFKGLILSLVTFFMASRPTTTFQEISETLTANESSLLGVAALLFVMLLFWLNPLTTTTRSEIFTPQRFEKKFIPGFAQGAVLCSGLVLAFLLSGAYRYVGFFIQTEDTALASIGLAVRVSALGLLLFCEEFIFRQKMYAHLRAHAPDAVSVLVTSLAYVGVKLLQFDLGIMQTTTLLLLSVAIFYRNAADGDFMRGAGFWVAIALIFQALLSLPILGTEFNGLVLIKYQSAIAGGLDVGTASSRFLTGGIGGPLSSFVFQLILVVDALRGLLRHKKILLNTAT